MKRDLKKILGLAGLFTSLYAGAVNIYPAINGTKFGAVAVAISAGISAYMDTQRKPPKNPKLPQ